MRKLWLSIGIAVLAIGAGLYFAIPAQQDETNIIEEGVRDIRMNIGQSIGELIQQKQFRLEEFDPDLDDDHFLLLFILGQTPGLKQQISLTIGPEPCAVTLPGAHIIGFGQRAGILRSASAARLEKPQLTFAQVMDQIVRIRAEFKAKGWKQLNEEKPEPTSGDELVGRFFRGEHEKPRVQVNKWQHCVNSDVKMRVDIKRHNFGPKAAMTPPVLLSPGLPEDQIPKKPYFYLSISISNSKVSLFNYFGQLINPRRIFENGSIKEEVPLRHWIEDPDWRPKDHGMEWLQIKEGKYKGEYEWGWRDKPYIGIGDSGG